MADVAIPSSGGGAFVVGMYTGDGAAERTIQLGFTPSAVLVVSNGNFNSGYVGKSGSCLFVQDMPTDSETNGEFTSGGFKVRHEVYDKQLNWESRRYPYIAFR